MTDGCRGAGANRLLAHLPYDSAVRPISDGSAGDRRGMTVVVGSDDSGSSRAGKAPPRALSPESPGGAAMHAHTYTMARLGHCRRSRMVKASGMATGGAARNDSEEPMKRVLSSVPA